MNIADLSESDLDVAFLDWSREVKYRRILASDFNTKTGVRTDTEPDLKVDAIVSPATHRQVAASGGSVLRGDVFFVFFGPEVELLNMRWRRLAEEPATTHRVVDGSTVFEVVSWDASTCGRLREVLGRRVR